MQEESKEGKGKEEEGGGEREGGVVEAMMSQSREVRYSLYACMCTLKLLLCSNSSYPGSLGPGTVCNSKWLYLGILINTSHFNEHVYTYNNMYI